ncbi:hypothetical protein BX600DRAFT_378351 [Xylariales sp. PMI_506]|nr:hypothetical protein BX600DRAFT_378351 [Xylariales sp. PMI_506]
MATTSQKIVLITGANTGIGWETVKALLQTDTSYKVLLGTRSLDKGRQALEALKDVSKSSSSTVDLLQIDIASDESIDTAFERVQSTYGHIDILVNNAGIATDADMAYGDMSTREAWNKAYDVNVSGTMVATEKFVPLLLRSSDPRLLFITSGLASLDKMSQAHYPAPPPIPAGWPKNGRYTPSAYRASKTALNMMMLCWHWVLKEDGVKVWSISPGYLATGLGGPRATAGRKGAGDASIGGKLIMEVIEGERDADVGKVVSASGGIQAF